MLKIIGILCVMLLIVIGILTALLWKAAKGMVYPALSFDCNKPMLFCMFNADERLPQMKADGHSLAYIEIELIDKDGNRVQNRDVQLTAVSQGVAKLIGFGSDINQFHRGELLKRLFYNLPRAYIGSNTKQI